MGNYKITLDPELEGRYQRIATQLNMTVEQVLYAVVQVYAECLTPGSVSNSHDVERVREYEDRGMGL